MIPTGTFEEASLTALQRLHDNLDIIYPAIIDGLIGWTEGEWYFNQHADDAIHTIVSDYERLNKK